MFYYNYVDLLHRTSFKYRSLTKKKKYPQKIVLQLIFLLIVVLFSTPIQWYTQNISCRKYRNPSAADKKWTRRVSFIRT